MKNIITNLLFVVMALGLFTQCEEQIETTQPDNNPPDLALSKLSNFSQLINSPYDRMQAFNYLSQYHMLAGDALTDNAKLVNNTGRYVGELVNQNGTHYNYWGLYAAINDCNIILDRIDTLYKIPTQNTAANRVTIRTIVAQAYFLRAMAYFDMLRVYGYEPNQIVNNWDKGVVLRDKPTFDVSTIDKRPRATVEDGYEFVESDLLKAIDSLAVAGTTIPNSPFRPIRAAAHALLARVYLHWGKDAEAITQANLAISTKPAAIRLATAAEYPGMWNTTIANGRLESLFELKITPGSSGSNADWSTVDGVNNSLHSLTTVGISASSQFVLAASNSLFNAYEPNDVRKSLWTTVNVRGQEFQMCLKWSGSGTGAGSPGFWADNIPVIRLPEVYMILAEANFNLGNEPAARTALNTIRSNRGLPALTAATSGVDLFNTILNERRVEFAFEGQRWFDLKRNGLDIPKENADPVAFTDFRVLAPIPVNQIILNPIIEQNPGY
ncbi:MAG: RagB/SusD family nutrient uptake outer membrane protein [Cytophagales bacterium]|nr:RagB/SusD family nutrient uptake outer membrane protein [Cytophagales bacterium]